MDCGVCPKTTAMCSAIEDNVTTVVWSLSTHPAQWEWEVARQLAVQTGEC